ncbi:MAG TPA: hypothetical protein VFB58_10525 [Chloroflexota bacterium]|nr:hypothetical protein [Chloroflexota bacterium]
MRRITHNRSLLALTAVVFALLLSVPLDPLAHGGTAAASGKTITFSGQVVNAFAFSSQNFGPSGPPPGSVEYQLNVFQSGTQTMLEYTVCTWQWDSVNDFWNCVLTEGGFGLIPSSAVQSSGGARPTNVSLNVDTSSLSSPNFQLFAGSGGTISLTWKAVPGYTNANSGNFHSTSSLPGPSFSYSSSASSYSSSAGAQGTILGYTVPDPTAFDGASMGSMQGMSACQGC